MSQFTNDSLSQIKAIETEYKGYRFRSRLEARWAVFFENIGMNWRYEPEGYDLGKVGYYLPDFLILSPQGYNFYYEIKPNGYVNDGKLDTLIKLLKESQPKKEYVGPDDGTPVFEGSTLIGDPIDIITKEIPTVCPRCGVIRPDGFECGGGKYVAEINCGCAICDFTEGNGHYTKKEVKCLFDHNYHKGWIMVEDEDERIYSKSLLLAATLARKARFEHGEKP